MTTALWQQSAPVTSSRECGVQSALTCDLPQIAQRQSLKRPLYYDPLPDSYLLHCV